MSELDHELTHRHLGVLEQIADDLAEGLAFLRDDVGTFDADAVNPLAWAAGTFADLELGRLYRGVTIFNLDAANDVFVGFAAGQGTAAKSAFVISARGYLTLPIVVSHISVGGAGVGKAVVIGWRHAPLIDGGKF